MKETATTVLEAKLALGLQVAGIGLGQIDFIADTITLDARAGELFDLPSDTAISRADLHARINPEDWANIRHEIDTLENQATSGFLDVEHRVSLPDGSLRWVNARKQIILSDGKDGSKPKLLSGVVAVLDVTAHKMAEARLQFMGREVAHRSKNLMAIVQAIARMTASTAAEKDFANRFSKRISALAFNQDVLVNNSWTHVALHDLLEFHLTPFKGEERDAISISGPAMELSPEAAQGIGMALYELATNAAKYGALSVASGKVEIEWSISGDADSVFNMSWAEHHGPPVTRPTKTGFGQTVIEDMVATAVSGDVVLEYAPAGLHWQLTAPSGNVMRTAFI